MKTLLYFILIISALTSYGQKPRDLDKMDEKKRNEYLVNYAKKVVKKHGPDYYRKEKPPVIDWIVVNEKNDSISSGRMCREHEGRAYYIVTFLHDPYFEYMHTGFAARVFFWADTGIAFSVSFGNGWGYVDLDQPEKYKNKKMVMQYKWLPPIVYDLDSYEQKPRDLDKMKDKKRNEFLVDYAQKVIKTYGLNHYREEEFPVINRIVVHDKNDSISSGRMRREHQGRAYYIVTYFREYTYTGFAARVFFWADTGIAFSVYFGHGWGYVDLDKPEKDKNPQRVRWEPPRKEYSRYRIH